jgi:hypothetical protein
MDFENDKLNDDWINNFEKTDKLYQDFYRDDLYYINLKFLYVNRENFIEKIKIGLVSGGFSIFSLLIIIRAIHVPTNKPTTTSLKYKLISGKLKLTFES